MKFIFFLQTIRLLPPKPHIWNLVELCLFNNFTNIYYLVVVVWLKNISKLRVYFSKNCLVNNHGYRKWWSIKYSLEQVWNYWLSCYVLSPSSLKCWNVFWNYLVALVVGFEAFNVFFTNTSGKRITKTFKGTMHFASLYNCKYCDEILEWSWKMITIKLFFQLLKLTKGYIELWFIKLFRLTPSLIIILKEEKNAVG